jgi:hypothetical protein
MLNKYAVFSSTAETSRKSRFSAPGTLAACQIAPPSVVRRKVPLVPLAQTTLGLAALTPRNDAVVPLVWAIQEGFKEEIAITRAMRQFIWAAAVYALGWKNPNKNSLPFPGKFSQASKPNNSVLNPMVGGA